MAAASARHLSCQSGGNRRRRVHRRDPARRGGQARAPANQRRARESRGLGGRGRGRSGRGNAQKGLLEAQRVGQPVLRRSDQPSHRELPGEAAHTGSDLRVDGEDCAVL